MADYADFEILVQQRQGDVYPVILLRSAAGDAKGEIRLSIDEVKRLQQDAHAFRAAVTSAPRDICPQDVEHLTDPDAVTASARELGGALFAALFSGEIRTRLATSRAIARENGLRLRLRIEPPELAVLPWELVYDPDLREHIALSRKTPIVRYVPVGQPPERRRRGRTLRMLAADASPKGLPKLDVRRERERLDWALRGLRAQRLLDISWYNDATEEGFRERLTQSFDIVHFAGHGGVDRRSGVGHLVLCEDDGWEQMTAQELARLLRDNHRIRLLVLNCCEGAGGGDDAMSSLAVASLEAGVPAVLAMQSVISDEAAVELTRVVYGAVARGRPIDEALAEARQALSMAEDLPGAWATPVLYLRAADGRLFAVPNPIGTYALGVLGLVVAALLGWSVRSFGAGPPEPPPPPDTSQYGFEEDTQGWVGKGIITGVSSSADKAHSGARSLAVTFTGEGIAQVSVSAPPVAAGQTITFRIWVPAASSITSVQPFVIQGAAGKWAWTGNWQPIANLSPGSWKTLTLTVPATAATPLDQLGIELATKGAWSGTFYVDAVSW